MLRFTRSDNKGPAFWKFLDLKASQNLIPFQCSTSRIGRASHVSTKQTKKTLEHGLLDFIYNFKRHFLEGRVVRQADASRCVCSRVICPEQQQNGSDKNALYGVSVRRGSIAYLKL